MRLIRTLCLALPFLLSTTTNAQWSPLSLGVNGSRSITTFNGAIFIAAPPNGIRKSTNDGTSWLMANTGLPTNGSTVRSIGHSENTLFCGTESGVFRSTDNGASWISANNTLPASSSTIYCNKIYTFGTAMFLVYTGQLSQNGGGVFRTFDNGVTWLQAYSGLNSNMVVSGLAQVGDALYAATNTGLMRSDDLGTSWQPAGTTNWAVRSVQGQNGALVILGAFGAQRSVNGGTTWTATTGYPTTNCPEGSELVIFDGYYIAITKNAASGCYRSMDDGLTWTAFNDGLSAPNTFAQERFHISPTHLYIACALDSYRIESTTTGVNTASASTLPTPYPTVFTDRFAVDLSTVADDRTVLLIDATGRAAERTATRGGGVVWIERNGLVAGRYHCLLIDPNTGNTQHLGQVIAE